MAEVTVSQLAEVVGAPVERLLRQMKEAGLSHSSADEVVSDEDKQTLLTFLKRSHGESTEGPRKITLKRKTISTLKTGSGSGKKTVNIEVRKKRTYVKRDPAELHTFSSHRHTHYPALCTDDKKNTCGYKFHLITMVSRT